MHDEGFSRLVEIEAEAGLMRYVVEKGSIAVDGVSLTVASLAEERSASRSSPRRSSERPWAGLARRPVNLEVDVLAKYVERLWERRSDEHARNRFLDHRGSPRGHPRGQDGRRLRRRGPRERGRPRDGGAVRHARGHQLHGQAGARAHLPGADRGTVRRAGARPHGGQERVAVRDGVHGLDRGPRGRHHRDLGARPRPHDPGGDRPGIAARTTVVEPGHVFPLKAREGGVLERAGHTEAAASTWRGWPASSPPASSARS